MNFPSDGHNAYVLIPHQFPAIRIFNSLATATKVEMKISCSPWNAQFLTPDKLEENCSEGYKRLQFWFDAILDNVILVDINSEKMSAVMSLGNSVMFIPGPPTDHLIITLLHAKLSAILKGYFDIHALSIKTEDTGGIETVYRKIDNYDLPSIKYFPGEALHQKPWWLRDTVEICEFRKGEVIEDQLFNHFSDFFKETDNNEEAEVIVFNTDKDADGQV